MTTRSEGTVRLIGIRGSLTLARGDLALRAAVRELFEAGHRRVVLDLRGVDYVDSSGLGEMIACKRQALELGGNLVLLQPQARVRSMLVMSRLDSVLEIFEDEVSAIASMKEEGA